MESGKLAGHVLGKVGHWGKFVNWDIAVLQASCTGAEKKGFH